MSTVVLNDPFLEFIKTIEQCWKFTDFRFWLFIQSAFQQAGNKNFLVNVQATTDVQKICIDGPPFKCVIDRADVLLSDIELYYACYS